MSESGDGTDGELDFHVTFPTPNVDLTSAVKTTEEVNNLSRNEPVVILLGWAGCQDRHLAKYGSIYDKRCITVRYTAPTTDIFYRTEKLRNIAVKMLELMADLNLLENPLFIHSFSNGGGFVYHHLSDLIHNGPGYSKVRLCGALFDSCPAPRRLMTAVRAYTTVSQHGKVLSFLLAIVLFVYLFLKGFLQRLASIVLPGSGIRDRSDYWNFMQRDPARCPQLYVYSTEDKLVSYKDIEKVMAARREVGVHVQSCRWTDSPHVTHYPVHQEEYTRACLQFVDMCMQRAAARETL